MHSDDDTHRTRRGGAFFGRRKGKKLRSHQAHLMRGLLPRLALDLSQAAPASPGDLFPVEAKDVRLEIGFGGGEHLIAQAQRNPETGFIGIEPFENGMAKALAAIERQGIANIRLHHGDATELLDWLPSDTIARVDLLYPDPWPKRRHWKRRFVQDESVAAIARILRSGGEFRFASDIADYCAWTLVRLIRSADFEWTAEKAIDWQSPWPDYERTRYEAKAVHEGRTPCYLTFRRR